MHRIWLIAFRNITGQKIQSLATALGVSFSVLLISVLLGLYAGWSRQVTRFLGAIDADIWIGQKGSTNISRTVSFIPNDLGDRIKEVEGIEKVTPFLSGQVRFTANNKDGYLQIVGSDNAVIRPFSIIKGKPEVSDGELVVDEGLVVQKGLGLGDKITVNGGELTIVGISTGGNMLFFTYGLAPIGKVEEILKRDAFTSYLIVNIGQDQSVVDVVQRLRERFPDLEIMTKDEFVANNAEIVRDAFLPMILVLTIITFISGILIIGLMIYNATVEKRHEYGVLKALGYSNGELFMVALLYSMFASVVGLGIASGFLLLILNYVPDIVSGFIIYLGTREIIAILASTFLMGIFASLIPLSTIVEIDPANVFKN